jgi:hypothetical protein
VSVTPAPTRHLFRRFGLIDDARRHQRRRRLRTHAAAVALGVALGILVGSAGGRHAGAGFAATTMMRLSGRTAAGYEVTFRYQARDASSVRIVGEWYFSSPAETTAWTSQGLLPTQWRPGDFPMAWPNGPYGGWPMISMRKDPRTGVWSFTTPLPSGLYDYRFLLNCSEATLGYPSATWCGQLTPTQSIYVPPDPGHPTGDYSWESPAFPQGRLTAISGASMIGRPALAGVSTLSIYTPPGYDPRRATRYPTLYVVGGSGTDGFSPPAAGGAPGMLENGSGGLGQTIASSSNALGDLATGTDTSDVTADTSAGTANILDNLIDKRAIPPTVVVFTNFVFGPCNTGGWAGYDDALVNGVIPLVASHYDVSAAPAQRAVVGLACGATMAGSLLARSPGEFRSYGLIGPLGPLPGGGLVDAAIRRATVMVGGGLQDPAHAVAVEDLARLRQLGTAPMHDFVNGGQESYVWRLLLHDFLMRTG